LVQPFTNLALERFQLFPLLLGGLVQTGLQFRQTCLLRIQPSLGLLATFPNHIKELPGGGK
jgi:hypothetical protein